MSVIKSIPAYTAWIVGVYKAVNEVRAKPISPQILNAVEEAEKSGRVQLQSAGVKHITLFGPPFDFIPLPS